MYTTDGENQLSFSDQFFDPREDPIPDDHPYLILIRELPWSELLSRVGDFYSDTGRPSIPVKHMVFLLLIKHQEGYSDRELANRIGVDMALQKALNISFRDAQKYVHHSSFSKFREKLGEEGGRLIEEAVHKFVKKKAPPKTRKVFVDTTVCPADISYPTDIHLLEKARKRCIKIIKKYSAVPVRTYVRKARLIFLSYIKFRKAPKRKTRVIHGKMIRFVKRNHRQAQTAILSALKNKKKLSNEVKKELAMLRTIQTLLEQQILIYKRTPRSGNKSGISIPDRIVSIFRDHIRPIPRGKIPVPTEFGAKVLFELRGGFMRTLKITFNNTADSELLSPFIHRYSGFDVGGDRGFHSPTNRKLAEEHGVRNYCIEPKGRKKSRQDYLFKQMRKRRSAIEAKISLSKRKHGLRRNRYGRGPSGESIWIYLGIAAMNINHAFRIMDKKKRR